MHAAARTAIARTKLSRTARAGLEHGIFDGTVLDYGCGRGGDVERLSDLGVSVQGYDKYHRPGHPAPADSVMLSFVLNVIESPVERFDTLRDACRLARRHLLVSVRCDTPAKGAERHGDGWVTSTGTFQHHYTHAEARQYIADTLGVSLFDVRPLAADIFHIEKGA